MKIKEKKTTVMKFNFSKSKDFPPEISVQGFNENLQVVKEARALGVLITDDLKWEANTKFICAKAFKNMWTLMRMKKLKMDSHDKLDVYIKEIRSVLELAAPAWHSGLTQAQSASIERVQKIALSIVLSDPVAGKCFTSYSKNLQSLHLDSLSDRRTKLSLKFAKKSLKNDRQEFFKLKANPFNTRQKSGPFVERSAHSLRCFNSPVFYMTRLLNAHCT